MNVAGLITIGVLIVVVVWILKIRRANKDLLASAANLDRSGRSGLVDSTRALIRRGWLDLILGIIIPVAVIAVPIVVVDGVLVLATHGAYWADEESAVGISYATIINVAVGGFALFLWSRWNAQNEIKAAHSHEEQTDDEKLERDITHPNEVHRSFVRLHLEADLLTSEQSKQPSFWLHYEAKDRSSGGNIRLDAKFSILQTDEGKDPAVAFLRASAKHGSISVSISPTEAEKQYATKRGDIRFQTSDGKKYAGITIYVPMAEFRLIAGIIATLRRPRYSVSGKLVGNTFEWMFPWLRKEALLSLTLDFDHDPSAFREWQITADDGRVNSNEIDITYTQFHF